MKSFKTTALCAAVALLGFSAAASAKPGDSASEPLVVAFQGGADTLDPIMRSVTVAYSWQRNIFDTLTHQERDGSIVPRIITKWENVSPLQWKLTIRQGVKFHDGSDMTAEDVGLSIMDTKTNTRSQMQTYVSLVKDFEVVDAQTLLVNFNSPNPVFPVHLTNVVVMPERLIAEKGRDEFARHPIGTGPYKFVNWQTDDYLTLEAWDGFWGDKPEFKHVKYQKIPNNSTRIATLISGESQVVEGVAPSDFERIKEDKTLKIVSDPGRRIMYLGLDGHTAEGLASINKGGKNPFADVRVREAMSLGIDRKLIADKLFSGAVTPAGQFLPMSSQAFDKDLPVPAVDTKKAKQLLADAGYEDGFDLNLDTPNDRYMYDSLVAQGIAGLLKKAGVNTTVEAAPMTVHISGKLQKGTSAMYILGWGNSNSLSTWRSVFHCVDPQKGTGSSNYIKYCNPEADALIEKAYATFDDDERNALIRKAYNIAINQDYAYIPMYYQSEVGALKESIEWTPRPDGIVLAWEMHTGK